MNCRHIQILVRKEKPKTIVSIKSCVLKTRSEDDKMRISGLLAECGYEQGNTTELCPFNEGLMYKCPCFKPINPEIFVRFIRSKVMTETYL
jgi:hypothetical protein